MSEKKEFRIEKYYQSLINETIEIPINELETTLQNNEGNPDYEKFITVIKKVYLDVNG